MGTAFFGGFAKARTSFSVILLFPIPSGGMQGLQMQENGFQILMVGGSFALSERICALRL